MRLALVALVVALPAASSAEAPVPPRTSGAATPICGPDMKIRPVRSGEELRVKRLGELPPGDLTLTVLNRVGDCIEPATIRQGYGALGGATGR